MRYSLPDAECRVVAWYLVHRRAAPGSSSVRGYHFHNPMWREAWGASLTGGEAPEELGIPSAEHGRLAALWIRPEEIHACEHRIRQGWALRFVRTQLAATVEDMDSGRLEDLPGVVARVEEACRDAIAGGPVKYEIATAVGQRTIENARQAALDDRKPRYLPMPLGEMRTELPGWLRGSLHVIGGRTSEHKTTLARMSARYVERNGWSTLFWTMEDSSETICARDLAADDVGTVRQIISGHAGDLAGVTYVNDTRAMCDRRKPKLSDVVTTILGVHARRSLDLVVLDYVQLIRPDRGRADNEYWHDATTVLASLAKDIDAAILVTSQIDKSASQSTRNEKRIPTMHDMLFSSALCHDAQTVVMIGVSPGPRDDPNPTRMVRINVDKIKTAALTGWSLPVDAAHDTIGRAK